MSETRNNPTPGEHMLVTDLFEMVANESHLANLDFLTDHFIEAQANWLDQPILKISDTKIGKNKHFLFEHWPATGKTKITRTGDKGYEAVDFEQKEIIYGTPAITSLHWIPGAGLQSKLYLSDEFKRLPLYMVSLGEDADLPGQLDERSARMAVEITDIVSDRAAEILAEFRDTIENPPQSLLSRVGKTLGRAALLGGMMPIWRAR